MVSAFLMPIFRKVVLMAYSGWLVKIGDYIISTDKYIKSDSYSAYINTQALDPWTDASGYEHIDYVDLEAMKIEFETLPMLDDQYWEMMGNIRNNLFEKRKCNVTAYIPELHTYITQTCYLVDSRPKIYSIKDGKILYDSFSIAFVGGVYS